jgi:hypothetical protein
MNAAEIQALLDNALALRKKAYKINAPQAFIFSINYDIRRFRSMLAEVVA